MTDTLRKGLAEAAAKDFEEWCKPPMAEGAEPTMSHTIAFITAWALEPVQVERATKIACSTEDRHLMCSFPSCACKSFPRGVRAAIAALFEVKP